MIMSLEQAAIAALGVVCTALCFLFNLLRLRSEACEKWRSEKEPIITEMAQRLGLAEGVVTIINACKIKGCPHAGSLDSTFSLDQKNAHEKHP